jgi:outer membrane protein assembly factor BamE
MTDSDSPLLRGAALALALACASLAGCVYRINIPQGNFLENKQIDQVAVGMTRSQVRFLLGTPMLSDPFHPDRWDYLYYFKTGRTQKVEQHELIVLFADDKVARIEKPQGAWADPKVVVNPGF